MQQIDYTLRLVEIGAGDIDLNEKDVIGEGGQGCVYKAYWNVKQKPVAVKKINLSKNAAKREVMPNMCYFTMYILYIIVPYSR